MIYVCLYLELTSHDRTAEMVWTLLWALGLKATPESPHGESERTSWSTHNKRELKIWRGCHQKRAAKALEYTPAKSGRRRRLVFFGDSLTESWMEETYCRKNPKFRGASAVLRTALSRDLWPNPLLLGISADQTQHLLWRLRHGELTASMAKDSHLMFVLHIGTNNIGSGHAPAAISTAVEDIARMLLNSSRARVLIHGLLPRGDAAKRGGALAAAMGVRRPLCSFGPYVAQVNHALNVSVAAGGTLAREFGERGHYVDCGSVFAPSMAHFSIESGAPAEICSKGRAVGDVRSDLMPDLVHPNAAGHEAWAGCLMPAINRAYFASRDVTVLDA